MIMLVHGKSAVRTWSLSYRISHCLDTKIPPPYPESWYQRLFKQTFPEGNKEYAGL